MYDPKDILTAEGLRAYRAHLFNIEEGLHYILNHADDLHIGAMSNDKSLEALYAMKGLIESKKLETGDGERD